MKADLLRVLDHLRCQAGGLSDGQLLAQFVTSNDRPALEALVKRHGKMVYGVCRRVLRNPQDAEDAFQKTFLTLTRKAASVVKRDSFGAWLYNVAYHTALDLAASSKRRRVMERQVRDLPDPVIFPAEPDDWRPLLDWELSRLPERYRAAVVLCDLEGLTRKEAAARIGVPEGTVCSRLTTAHKILARRLARCGLAFSVCAVSAALSEARASSAVPTALAKSVASAALAAGSTPTTFFLLKGGLHTMFISKWWPIVGAFVVAAGLATVGVGFGPGYKAALAQAAPAKPESELEALKKENELLKRNLQIVLEKLGLMEAELETLRDLRAAKSKPKSEDGTGRLPTSAPPIVPPQPAVPVKPAAPAKPDPLSKLAEDAKAAEAANAALLEKLAADLKALEAEKATLLKRLADETAAKSKPAPAKDKLLRQLDELLKELRESKDKDANENALKKLNELLAK